MPVNPGKQVHCNCISCSRARRAAGAENYGDSCSWDWRSDPEHILDAVHCLATGFLPGVRQVSKILWPSSPAITGSFPLFSHTRSISLSHSPYLSSAIPAIKTFLHKPAWMGSSICGWRKCHHKNSGQSVETHMPWDNAVVSKEPLNWGHQRLVNVSNHQQWDNLDHANRGNGLLHEDRIYRCYTHLLTQETSKDFLNTCLETVVVPGCPFTYEQLYSRLGLCCSSCVQVCAKEYVDE